MKNLRVRGTCCIFLAAGEQTSLSICIFTQQKGGEKREWHFASGYFFSTPKWLFCDDISPKLPTERSF